MDIPLNADVTCADGTEARSVCIVVNPVNQVVTHIVIETKGVLGIEYMVPIDLITSSSPHKIQLRCTHHDLVQLEPFVRSQFIGPEDTAYPDYMSVALEREAAGGIFWPYSAYEDYGSYVGIEQIPYHELGIHRGAHVEASDGRIGTVDEFLINPENSHISHLVLREGHLWGQKDVTIPVSEIEKIEDDVVYLKLNKHTLKQMVGTSIQRNGR